MNDPVIRFLAVNTAVSLVLALAALGCGCGRARPQIVHLLWLAALVNLITPSVVRVPVWPASAAPERVAVGFEAMVVAPMALAASSADEVAEGGDFPRADSSQFIGPAQFSWRQWLLGFWAMGSAGWAGLALARMVRFQRLLRHAEPLDTVPPRVWVVDAPISPLLWAFFGRARIVVPRALFDSLAEAERDALLRHEWVHFRRRDHWVRWVEFVVLTAMWWHPLAWWASRRLRAAEEACCDAEVVTALADRRPYATALVRAALFLSETAVLPRAATGIGSAASIHRRIHSIMTTPASRRLSWPASLTLLTATAVAVLAVPVEKSPPVADEPVERMPLDDPPLTEAVAPDESASEPAGEQSEPPASETRAAPFEPGRHYLSGYMKVQEAEKEQRAGNTVEADLLFKEALALFESVQAQAPQWNPSMVAYRLNLVRRQLALGPISSLNGNITITSLERPNGPPRRVGLSSQLFHQPFAMVADRMEMVTPDEPDRSSRTRFDANQTQFSRTTNRTDPGPGITATGAVRGGWAFFRVSADRLEINSSGFTLTGDPVLLVDVSSDPPHTVVSGRRISLDTIRQSLTVDGGAVFLRNRMIHKTENDETRLQISLSSDGSVIDMRLGKGTTEFNLSDQKLESERALLLKTWPGPAVFEEELAPLLRRKVHSVPPFGESLNLKDDSLFLRKPSGLFEVFWDSTPLIRKDESVPPSPYFPPGVDGPRQEPLPRETTPPKKLPG